MDWIIEVDSKILVGYIQISVRMMAKQGWHGQFTGRLNRICMYTYILFVYIMLILEGILAEDGLRRGLNALVSSRLSKSKQ